MAVNPFQIVVDRQCLRHFYLKRMKYSLSLVLLVVCVILYQGVYASFGSKKKKAKQRLEQQAQDAENEQPPIHRDREALLDAMRKLKDPSTMNDVRQLMNDPSFVKEMERMKSDPKSMDAIQSAKDLYGNSERAAEIFSKLSKLAENSNEQHSSGIGAASTLLRTAKDPQVLSHAMNLLSVDNDQAGESEQEALVV